MRSDPTILVRRAGLLALGLGLVVGGIAEEAARPRAESAVREALPAWPRFRVSAGVVARSVGVGFRLDGSALDGFGLSGQTAGLGDVGIYRDGPNPVVYDDGAVGPLFAAVAGNPDDGTAFGRIDSVGQLLDTGRVDGDNISILGAVFRTHGTEIFSSAADETDRQTGAGPYIQVGWRIAEGPGWMVEAVTGWSFLQTRHGSGHHLLGTAQRANYAYGYDTLITPPLPAFPFVDPADVTGVGTFIVDETNPNVAGLGQNPTQSRSVRTVAAWEGSAELAVELDEVPIGLEAGFRAGPWEFWGTSGVTLNAVGYEFESRLRGTGPEGAFGQRWREEGTALRAGGFLGIGGRWALGRDGRWYAEARTSYRWVEPVQVRAGFATARIDPTSWEGGLGIGCRW